jgi:diguanylate cyclase (GGDEF)-like protein
MKTPSLKTKLVFTITVLFTVLMSLMSFFILAYFDRTLKQSISRQEFTMVTAIAQEISHKLQTAQKQLVETAKIVTPEVIASSESAQQFLDDHPSLGAIFDNHVFLFSPAGEIIAESPFQPDRRGLDFSHRDYIKETIATGQPVISDPYLSSQDHGHPAIMFTVPIYNGAGDLVAILAGGLDLLKDNFLGEISRTPIGQTGYLYIYNTDRTMIIHPDPSRILRQDVPLGVNRLFDHAIEGFEGTEETVNSRGIPLLASFKRINLTNWILVANHPQSEAYAPLTTARIYFIWATLFGLLLTIVIMSFAVSHCLKPLSLFTMHVHEMPQKTGRDRLFFIDSTDEIGALSLEFNKMVLELDHQVWHDQLTGLYNRNFFEQVLQHYCLRTCAGLGIIVCDVDGLKLTNDTLGHSSGDKILIDAATVIRRSFPGDTLIARVGGDEFVILLPKTDNSKAETACRQIRTNIDDYNQNNPTPLLSMSIGFAVGNDQMKDIITLYKQADDHMYREKLHRSKSTRSAIVQTLMKTIEARDFITEGHAERMKDLVARLAREYGIPDGDIAELRLFAQFHDIGKVGIPDNILFKTGALTPHEQVVMRRHPEIGHRIAQSSPELIPIADWILKHHEWWNGGGYPLGLKGDDIPLPCRMLAIVDAYDAMTSDRPYRKALAHETAIAELKRCAGTQFEPAMVDKFIYILKNRLISHPDAPTSGE